MATINDDYITEKEEVANDQIAQLEPISATDQATTTFSGDTSVQKEPPPKIQQGRFEGQGGAGTTSAVDLSNKDNEDQMWVEYENWKKNKSETPSSTKQKSRIVSDAKKSINTDKIFSDLFGDK